MLYFFAFILAAALSALLTSAVIKIAFKFDILDRPGAERKLHSSPMPLLGGIAVFLSFFAVMLIFKDPIMAGNLEAHHWLGVFFGALILMIGGFLDDKYDLKPGRQFVFPVLAIAAVLLGGVGIEKLTNPFGGYLYLDIKYVSGAIIFFWLLGMMYTTKLLDGLDGLVGGVTMIGSSIIFLFTLTTKYYQPDIALASLIFAGAILGFLVFNWHPAKIFLGEGGSLFLGFVLGVLAIISGGKIAIALLVMGLPIMDVAWTIIRRFFAGQNPFRFADRKHLHHRLLDLGLGVRKTVLVFYGFSLLFGLSALFLQSKGKVFALLALMLVMLGLIVGLDYWEKRGDKTTS